MEINKNDRKVNGNGWRLKGNEREREVEAWDKTLDTIVHVSCSMTLEARNGHFISNGKTHSEAGFQHQVIFPSRLKPKYCTKQLKMEANQNQFYF